GAAVPAMKRCSPAPRTGFECFFRAYGSRIARPTPRRRPPAHHLPTRFRRLPASPESLLLDRTCGLATHVGECHGAPEADLLEELPRVRSLPACNGGFSGRTSRERCWGHVTQSPPLFLHRQDRVARTPQVGWVGGRSRE